MLLLVSKEFVDELRFQFERYVQVKERLDTKANNIISMSGTISTLFMGFGVFLLQNVDFKTYCTLATLASMLLIIEVSLTVVTVFFAFRSYRQRTYTHPISYENFYDVNSTTPNSILNQFKEADPDAINDRFADNYLECIKSYEEQNNEQNGWIDRSRKTFIASLGIIPLFSLIMILTKYPPQ